MLCIKRWFLMCLFGENTVTKSVDFCFLGCYYMQVACESDEPSGQARVTTEYELCGWEALKKVRKNLKKSSWQRVWKVVIYLSCAKRRAPCKLNNVMNTKHQILDSLSRSSKAWSGTTLNFFEAMINGFNNLIWAAERSFKYHFIESLILAQDERWRRA